VERFADLPFNVCHVQVEDSPYNGMAYCEQFPRDFDGLGNDAAGPSYWAQVKLQGQGSGDFETVIFVSVAAHLHHVLP